MLAISYALESALQTRSKVFDFLRGAERYKYAWGALDLAQISMRIAEVEAHRRPTVPVA